MGDPYVHADRRTRRRIAARAFALALAGTSSLPAAAEPLKLYLYRENGMAVYTNRQPASGEYTVVIPGSGAPRPVLSMPPASAAPEPGNQDEAALIGWAASCKGVTPEVMEERAAQWQGLVTKHAKAHGVPAALVRAVMRVESCFDRRAVSRVGAQGLMQLMPATAAQLGVRDSFDADQNIAGGARYLGQLLARFDNDTRLAIAAYNAGPSAVDAHRGIPPFAETRSYVERVLNEYRKHSPRATSRKTSG